MLNNKFRAPKTFIREQYEGFANLEQVLCCCGLAGVSYITTCGDYVRRMWPSFGSEVLALLSKTAAGSSIVKVCGTLIDQTSLSIKLASENTEVVARGPTSTLIEVVEVLAWIGAACRASQNERISYCTPCISDDADRPGSLKTCNISYGFEAIENDSTADDGVASGRCWHSLFRNPTIARGYPVPTRTNEEKGAEMSIGTMARLGCTPWATRFMSKAFLKGFCTMFVPILTVGRSIVWHFLIDNDQRRITYNDGLSIPSTVGIIDYPTIETSRHFVGWTPSARISAGMFHSA